MTSWNITMQDGSIESITVFVGEEALVASKEHPAFERIRFRLAQPSIPSEEELKDLFDISLGLARRFERLSERVSVKSGHLFFDGDPMDSNLTKTILKYHADPDAGSFQPLVNLLEKLMTNPQEHSRQELYGWLATQSFALCDSGDFIAYKAVHDNGDGTYRSDSRGEAIVDGEQHEGQIPNYPGAIVEMPRSVVRHDPGQTCSVGLHAASWNFAKSFLRDSDAAILRIKVNPRDVVNVPSGGDKLRVCRYVVLGVATSEHESMVPTPEEQTIPQPPVAVKDAVAKQAKPRPASKQPAVKEPAKKNATKAAPKKAAPKASKPTTTKPAPPARANDPLPGHAYRGGRCQCGVQLEGTTRKDQRVSHLSHKAEVLGL